MPTTNGIPDMFPDDAWRPRRIVAFAREKLEAHPVTAMIAAHPWKSVAIAFATGVALGFARAPRSAVGRALVGGFGALVLATLRDASGGLAVTSAESRNNAAAS